MDHGTQEKRTIPPTGAPMLPMDLLEALERDLGGLYGSMMEQFHDLQRREAALREERVEAMYRSTAHLERVEAQEAQIGIRKVLLHDLMGRTWSMLLFLRGRIGR